MPGTDSTWNQDSPNSDLEIFVGPMEWVDASLNAVFGADGNNVPYLNVAVSKSSALFADATAALKRTGVYATPALSQQQFGTAASLPGPTQVANTSDPEGIRGYPPFAASVLPTLVGPQGGAIKKGIQVNSIDILYTVGGSGSLTSLLTSLLSITFIPGSATAPVTLALQNQTGAALAAGAVIQKVSIPVTTPAFLVTTDTQLYFRIPVTTSATASFSLYGSVLKCSYNFN